MSRVPIEEFVRNAEPKKSWLFSIVLAPDLSKKWMSLLSPFHRRARIERAVERALASSPTDPAEVMVVLPLADASIYEHLQGTFTQEWAEGRLKLLNWNGASPLPPLSELWNYGAQHTSGRFLAFFSDIETCKKNAFSFVSLRNEKRLDLVLGVEDPKKFKYGQWIQNLLSTSGRKLNVVIVSRSLFDQAGGFRRPKVEILPLNPSLDLAIQCLNELQKNRGSNRIQIVALSQIFEEALPVHDPLRPGYEKISQLTDRITRFTSIFYSGKKIPLHVWPRLAGSKKLTVKKK